MHNIIFFKGILETMDYFTDKCVAALDSLGAGTYIIDAKNPSTYQGEDFCSFMERDNKAVFLWNQIGLNLKIGNENLWEKEGVPIYDSIQDHPRNFADSLTNPPGDFHAMVLDRNHASFIREFYPSISKIHFLPNGGAAEGTPVPYAKRKIPVLYCGSVQQSVDEFPMTDIFEDQGREYYNEVIRMMIDDPQLTTEKAVKTYTDSKGLSEDQYQKLFLDTSAKIDMYVRRYFKLKFMHILEIGHIPVRIYGEHWDDGFKKPISIKPRISSKQCNEVVNDAQIALNFMPWYKDGASERVFNNMLGGALCFSDRSTYLEDNYEDGQDIIYFDLKDPYGFADQVSYYLEHTDEAFEIATRGRDIAQKNDTWLCRMKTFLSFLDEDK